MKEGSKSRCPPIENKKSISNEGKNRNNEQK